MLASISFNQSHKSNLAHNNRKNIHGNPDIDQSRLDENIYFVQKDIREVYEDTFGEAVESYNAKQSRKDRKIEDYYEKIRKDSKTHEQRELIVAIGEGKDGEEHRAAKKAALVQYAEEFQERNPNLAVYNMVLHDDEANPHLHINYVPNFESKRGLTRRVGMDKALQQQGIEGKGRALIKLWRERETGRIEELAKAHIPNFERANVGSHKYMKVPQFKEAKETFKQIEAEGLKKRQEIVKAISHIDELHSSKRALQAEFEAQRAIVMEFKERGKGLTEPIKKLASTPQYKAPEIEPIYEPEYSTDLLGRVVKMKKDEYEKMVASQKESVEKHKELAKNFDVIAERLKTTSVTNYYLSAELEQAKKAIPVQTSDFVSRAEHEKVKQALETSERRHEEKDKVIEQQKEQIKDLTQRIKQFKSMCIDFIKENVSKSRELMNAFARKFNLVKDVNESIKQDKEREQREKKMQRRSRDDWEMER
ncbi:plasmid recombination protein [Bacillus thuringiensis]|nr:plasmid recombination protein [Bacillus thuringiensis]MED1757273.1 plasmid recombination protein [Bacillus thuringiensis]